VTDLLQILPYLSLGTTLGMLALPLRDRAPFRMSYHKVGGLHFWRIGRLGGSFYIASSR
jgi:hypothetical protein